MTPHEAPEGASKPAFGYLPDPQRLEVPLERSTFVRALVLDLPVRTLADRVGTVRVLRGSDVALPNGVYWFEGINEPLLLQVGGGAPPGDASIAAVDGIAQEHPLTAAWGWAENPWLQADDVPPARFAVNDVVAKSITSGD